MIWLLGSFLFTAVLAGMAVKVCHRVGLLDHPQGRKQHARSTPLCGGLVFWVALSVLGVSGRLGLGLGTWDWMALHAMALLGFLDDLRGLNARVKAVAGFAVAVMLALSHGLPLVAPGGTFPVLGMMLPNAIWLTLPLLCLWFWFLPQATNLMDGMNGNTLHLEPMIAMAR